VQSEKIQSWHEEGTIPVRRHGGTDRNDIKSKRGNQLRGREVNVEKKVTRRRGGGAGKGMLIPYMVVIKYGGGGKGMGRRRSRVEEGEKLLKLKLGEKGGDSAILCPETDR